MDLGATICTPKRPACALCPWMTPCRARAGGPAGGLSEEAEEGGGQLRRGAAFVVLRADDAVLLRTRPPKGLLGGMAEPPTSAWEPDYDPRRAMLDAPLEARWTAPARHRAAMSSRIFPLELTVLFAHRGARHAGARRHALDAPRGARRGALPGSMKKVLAHALPTPTPAGKAVKPPRP